MKKTKHYNSKQRGMTTLIVSIALLVVTTMGVMFSANVGIMEKKIATNDLRASQAMLSAQAGIDIALANISKYGLTSPVAPYTTSGNNFITNGDQAITYDDGSSAVVTGYYNITIDTTAANYPEKITIVSEGKSDDKTATAKISQSIIFAPSIRDSGPDSNTYLNTAVLIVSADKNGVFGNAEIDESIINNIDPDDIDRSTQLKVWVSGTIKDGNKISALTPELVPKSLNVTYGKVPPLNRLFISNMRDPANTGSNSDNGIKQVSVRSQCSTSCTNPAALTNNPNSKMHYLEGDITISGITIGTSTAPVILVVDNTDGSSFTLKNATINGLILVKGTWDNTLKSATVNGSIIVEGGDLLEGKNITINYSQYVDDNLDQVGTFTRIPGGWSDIN